MQRAGGQTQRKFVIRGGGVLHECSFKAKGEGVSGPTCKQSYRVAMILPPFFFCKASSITQNKTFPVGDKLSKSSSA